MRSMMNEVLSIAITTYMRADILSDILEHMIPIVEKKNIGIYISDNKSTDHTKEILKKAAERYQFLFYHINEENIGFDKSFEWNIKRIKSDYVWIMGDYSYISDDSIDYLLDSINEEQHIDFIALNNMSRVKDQNIPKYMTDCREVMGKIGWHITLLDTHVWNTSIISQLSFKRFQNTLFAYLGVYFEYMGTHNFRLKWIEKPLISNYHSQKISLWMKKSIDVWSGNFTELILSLPLSYGLDVKKKILIEHGVKSELFAFKNMVYLKEIKALNVEKINSYNQYLSYTIDAKLPRLYLLLCLYTPNIILSYLHRFKNKIYKLRNKNY